MSHLQRCRAALTVTELLDALEAFRLLAPEREGPRGVRGLNLTVERWLSRSGQSSALPSCSAPSAPAASARVCCSDFL